MSGSSRGRAGGRDSAVKAGHVLAGEAGRNRPVSFSRGTGGAHSPQKARTRGGRLGLTGNGRLRLALASKSPARLATLRAAGFDPLVQVSDVDEEALLESVRGGPAQKVLALATAKARAVAYDAREAAGADIVVGCDSMFEFDGQAVGKPHDPGVARERLARMSGRSGVLHTGHCLVHPRSGATLGAVSHAVVHIGELSRQEIDAYVASGEPLHVAGSFTVDGLGGPFVDRVDGDHHGVVGVSLPLLRRMLAHWGLSVTQLWERPADGELGERAAGILRATTRYVPRYGADAFIACSCGGCHWGLNGAGGVLAFRRGRGGVEVLAQLRSARTHTGGTWSVPGGAVEWGESPVDGAVREFAEETQIGAEDLEILGTHADDHGDWAYTTVIARCEGAEPVPDYESAQLTWTALDGLPGGSGLACAPLHPGFAAALPALREKIRNLAGPRSR